MRNVVLIEIVSISRLNYYRSHELKVSDFLYLMRFLMLYWEICRLRCSLSKIFRAREE